MGAKFDIKDSAAIKKHIQGGIDTAAEKALLAAATRVVQNITTEIIPAESRPPVDKGAFRAGWRAQPTPGGAEIVNTLPYASIIEYGARAENIKIGRAMIEALTGWVQRKGFASGDDARPIAWAIAQNMRKHGIFNNGKGLRVLEKALKNVQAYVIEEYERELKRIFESSTGGGR